MLSEVDLSFLALLALIIELDLIRIEVRWLLLLLVVLLAIAQDFLDDGKVVFCLLPI